MKSIAYIALLALLIASSGCTYYQQGKALEKAAEPYVDQAVDDIVARLCSMPIDIMGRQLDTDDKALGAYLLCPPLRDLVDTINDARDLTGT